VVKGELKGKCHFMDSSRPCKLKANEEQSKYVDLAKQNAFGPTFLPIQKSI